MLKQCSDVDAAYIAGFVDGEGTINVLKTSTGRFQVEFSVAQISPLPLKFITDRFGGIFYERTVPNRPNSKPIWKLAYTAKNFDVFIERIYPFLVLKKEKALIAMEMRKILKSSKYKRNISEKENDLKTNLVLMAKKYSQ